MNTNLGTRMRITPTRKCLAIASFACSATPVTLSVWAFQLCFFGPDTRQTGEEVLSSAIYSLWLSPLLAAGLGLGAFARGYRLACIGVSLLSIACWVCIIAAEGGL